MGEMKALFDTNILIDFLNGIADAKKEIEIYRHRFISRISWIEVMVGAESEKEQKVTGEFLEDFKIMEIDQAVSEEAVRIRQKDKIRLPDALIAATAQVHHCLLVTRNSKDFDPKKPWVRIPYKR
jgi:predicted nucleic acid-binding protein